MRFSTLTAAAALAALASSPAYAVFSGDIGDLGTPATDLIDLPSADEQSGDVRQETSSNLTPPPSELFRSPYEDLSGLESSSYTALGADAGNAFAVYNLGGSFLNILWGSPDDTGGSTSIGDPFNSPDGDSRQWIEFYSDPDAGGTLLDTVTAADLKTSALFDDTATFGTDGTADGFAWASFTNIGGSGETFQSIRLVHTSPQAFEVDGVVTPLPAAAWLMIGGLGAVGAYARRARKAAPTA